MIIRVLPKYVDPNNLVKGENEQFENITCNKLKKDVCKKIFTFIKVSVLLILFSLTYKLIDFSFNWLYFKKYFQF